MRVLVISDSRGWPIYNQIMGINWLLLGMTLDILIYPGATISQGIRYAINDIQYNAYDIIIGSIFGKRALLAIDHIMLALFGSYVPNMKLLVEM